nr:DUF3658 domain-containing protein [Metabacillus kandeliae]
MFEKVQQVPPLKEEEINRLADEWLAISEEGALLRLWENGRIVSVSEDYLDEFILKRAKKVHRWRKKYMAAARLIGETIGHLDQYIGDDFIEYRIRKLVEKGELASRGRMDAFGYEVRRTI